MKCLLHAIKPKSYLKDDYPEIENEWLCFGLPELIVVDNATEFYSIDFEDACAQLGISIHYAPLKKSWYRVSIERYFRTVNQRLLHELPGTTFSNIFDREDYDPEKNAAISFDALLKILHIWVVDDYHQKIHSGIEDIPSKRWRESIIKWEPNLPPNNKSLKTLLGFIEHRTISRNGIEIFGLHYNCQELSLIRQFSGVGNELIKYDPDDISSIYCYNRRDDVFITVPALDQEYTRGLTLYQHEAIKKYNKKILKNLVNEEGLRKTKAVIQEVIFEDIRSLKTIAQREKFMRLLNIGQPDYTPQENELKSNENLDVMSQLNSYASSNSLSGISNIGILFDEKVNDTAINEDSTSIKIIPLVSKKKRKVKKRGSESRSNQIEEHHQSESTFYTEESSENTTFSSDLDDEWSVGYDLPTK